MGDVPPVPPDASRPITALDLAWVLFGNPINPQDKGLIGAMQDQVKATQRQVATLIKLAWAILLLFLAATLSLTANLIYAVHH